MVEETLAATAAPASVSVMDDTMISDGGGESPSRTGGGGAAGNEAPATIGRYAVLFKLGAGAMGEVLAAYDPRLDRKVALKRIHPGGGSLDAARIRLEREAQALAKLDDRNVVKVHDVVIHQGSVFVAMEFVEGETLGQWMRAGPKRARPWREVVPVFEDVGRGLGAVHAVGLVHRDVKPGNVMIGKDGRVRVMDFGLARIETDDTAEPGEEPTTGSHPSLSMTQALFSSFGASRSRGSSKKSGTGSHPSLSSSRIQTMDLTQAGALLGTPAYMAPEQFAGERATARSDQFGFCIALYEALYGRRPFSGASMIELSVAVLEGRMDEGPRDGDISVPAWLRAVVLRGLSTDPRDRYASMEELLAALGTGELRRKRRRWAAAGLSVAVLAAGFVGAQRWDLAQREQACVAAGDVVDESWNPAARDALRAGILATQLSYAPTTVERVLPWLDSYSESWRAQAHAACTAATVDERWDLDTQNRASWCLEQRRGALIALVERMSQAEIVDVQYAVQLAAALQSPIVCTDERALADMVEPPTPALRPQVLALQERLAGAERFDGGDAIDAGAIELARGVQRDARELPWLPLAVRAQRFEATLLRVAGKIEEAEPLGAQAYGEAARAGLWAEASSAGAMLGSMIARQPSRQPEARLWLESAEIARAHASDPLGLLRGEIEAGLADVERAVETFDLAIEHGERALADVEAAFGPEHPRVADAVAQLADKQFGKGDYQAAQALQTRALELARASLGPDHPQVGRSLTGLGAIMLQKGEREAAARYFEQAIAIFEVDELSRPSLVDALNRLAMMLFEQDRNDEARALIERAIGIIEITPTITRRLEADTIHNLGLIHRGAGDYARARELYERALTIYTELYGEGHLNLAASHNNIAILLHLEGQLEAAEQRLVQAVEIEERALGPNHPELVTKLANLGRTRGDLKDYAGALEVLNRALAINEHAIGRDSPDHGPILTRIGTAAAGAGDHLGAIAAFERAVELLAANEDGWALQLARTRLALATELWDAPAAEGRDRERARALAEQARDGFAQLGNQERVDTCVAWLAEHR
ncbi:serine/threonine-protein kinase [Enhygromyxa salina]|uniref:Serine/threonine-protein kinase PrkC n=1 Tax=Enhygromyxa salina TaxID=215803 RepID=A0A2S9Y4G1_9BACT|nr:serine/threonine-protein kinase [Enhygromyxa salina]PRP99890.1 Serine/threonine-protein kinase PrkC [Enhygromyxa salina]